MYRSLTLAMILCLTTESAVRAQVDLSTYANSQGRQNVQKLTCAQSAATFQSDADLSRSGTTASPNALPQHWRGKTG
jgi:hypothetical protein